MLLLLLSRFSCVRLCATPQMVAHQAPPSLAFSRQEYRSGLPFPSPMHESEKWQWSLSVVSNSSRPMNCSLPGSSIHGIFQARVLNWGAIAFSSNDHWVTIICLVSGTELSVIIYHTGCIIFLLVSASIMFTSKRLTSWFVGVGRTTNSFAIVS